MMERLSVMARTADIHVSARSGRTTQEFQREARRGQWSGDKVREGRKRKGGRKGDRRVWRMAGGGEEERYPADRN